MILRKCFNCQHNYVTKNWDDIKCPYCGAYNVYKKGVKKMKHSLLSILIYLVNNRIKESIKESELYGEETDAQERLKKLLIKDIKITAREVKVLFSDLSESNIIYETDPEWAYWQ